MYKVEIRENGTVLHATVLHERDAVDYINCSLSSLIYQLYSQVAGSSFDDIHIVIKKEKIND